jgi:DNA polymerase-4
MNKIYFHIDANSAYLSWEAVYRLQHGDPIDLRTIPAVIGGDPKTRHGIVLAKSIPAKKYNIQTGETLYKAFQKCPHLVAVSPRYELYMKASNAMHAILSEFSPRVQRFSIDESFIDFNMPCPTPLKIAHTIGSRIRDELGFTVNIGISNNKLLAKVASDFQKPDRVHTLFTEEIQEKMWPLPVEDLFMVGRATTAKLHAMGIRTIGELANTDPDFLRYKLKSHGQLVWEYANGIESSRVRTAEEEMIKGLGNSTTLPQDIDQRETALMYLLALTEMVAMRLRNAEKLCQVVVVSIRNGDLSHYSHQMTLFSPTDHTNAIFDAVKKLFGEAYHDQAIRHLGVRVTGLVPSSRYQYSIFDVDKIDQLRALDQTVDQLRLKYGKNAIFRGVFTSTKIKPVIGGVGESEYKMMTSLL